MKISPFKTAALVCTALVGSIPLSAIDYVNFNTSAGLTLNGSATTTGGVLRLTPAVNWQAGSAFSTDTVSLNSLSSFSTRFQFQIGENGGITDENGPGADGIVFVVQTVSNNVGASGSGIGYQGIPNSVGIEFDTYNNGYQDDYSGNHVGINLNGNPDSEVTSFFPTDSGVPGFNNDEIWTSWVDYDGLNNLLEVRVNTTGIRPTAATLSYTVNLASILGVSDAYIGFTSATGEARSTHDILNWSFNAEFEPIGNVDPQVPDTGSTVALLGTAFAGLVLLKRRARR